MARVTVEDCIDKMPGSTRFGLCMFASTRAQEIVAGADITIKHNKLDKPPVIALREIAAGNTNFDTLKEIMVKSMRSTQQLDDAREYVASTEKAATVDCTSEELNQDDLIFDGSSEELSEGVAGPSKDEKS